MQVRLTDDNARNVRLVIPRKKNCFEITIFSNFILHDKFVNTIETEICSEIKKHDVPSLGILDVTTADGFGQQHTLVKAMYEF